MEVSFGANQTPVQPIAEPVPAAAAVPATVPTNRAVATSSFVLGDRIPDLGDIILPRVNIAQNIGPLSDQFPSGTLVFDSQGSATILYTPEVLDPKGKVVTEASPPVQITFLGFAPRRYSEKTEGGARGIIVKTEAEVRNAGGTTSYDEWQLKKAAGIKYFQILEDLMVVIQRPEACADDDTVFTYTVEGKKYALGLWAQKGSVYTECAKRVLLTQRRIGYLQAGGYPSYHFSVTTWEKPFGAGKAAWVPKAVPDGKSSPAFIAWVAQVLQAPGQ